MKLRVFVAVVAVVGALGLPGTPASAARGFSWLEGPFLSWTLDGVTVRAQWRANYADPRCPNEPQFDDYDDAAHACVGLKALIGYIGPGGQVVFRGSNTGAVPRDNYQGWVEGGCRTTDEAMGTGRDPWIAVWVQEITHRPDHHQMRPNTAPPYQDLDYRFSTITYVYRCDLGNLYGRVA